MKIKLLLGLGNPGNVYQATRHNIGFMVIDSLISFYGLKETRKHPLIWIGKTVIENHEVIVAKPLTFMNLSGKAVLWLKSKYEILPCEMLIVHDDMDIPWGRLKLVRRGGAGGHKGVLSIHSLLRTQDIPRLKIGIGRPNTEDAIDYVLSEFSPFEKKQLRILLEEACNAIVKTIT
ncbi:MAG TPA: aminoacyl-tRNA hydrolase, partial [Candidatus Desulfofervidus auxilii]|nr:aminoacyl-tRNA hydrolase [Candidatus Desulfofervidus auxilii]